MGCTFGRFKGLKESNVDTKRLHELGFQEDSAVIIIDDSIEAWQKETQGLVMSCSFFTTTTRVLNLINLINPRHSIPDCRVFLVALPSQPTHDPHPTDWRLSRQHLHSAFLFWRCPRPRPDSRAGRRRAIQKERRRLHHKTTFFTAQHHSSREEHIFAAVGIQQLLCVNTINVCTHHQTSWANVIFLYISLNSDYIWSHPEFSRSLHTDPENGGLVSKICLIVLHTAHNCEWATHSSTKLSHQPGLSTASLLISPHPSNRIC